MILRKEDADASSGQSGDGAYSDRINEGNRQRLLAGIAIPALPDAPRYRRVIPSE
ncbi:hypothetical protein D3C84_1249760 [compost metagenome]